MEEIDDVISGYRDGFLRLDADLLSSLWADDDILYSPAELVEPITSKPHLDAYYRNIAELFDDVERMEVFDVHRQRLHTDTIAVYFGFRFRAHFAGGAVHSVAGRVTIVLVRHESRWRGVHYHESLNPQRIGEPC